MACWAQDVFMDEYYPVQMIIASDSRMKDWTVNAGWKIVYSERLLLFQCSSAEHVSQSIQVRIPGKSI
jgi:hypothetical protein